MPSSFSPEPSAPLTHMTVEDAHEVVAKTLHEWDPETDLDTYEWAARAVIAALDVPALLAELTEVRARLSAVLGLCDHEERNAMRWQDPIPVPEWVAPVQRAALGADWREWGESQCDDCDSDFGPCDPHARAADTRRERGESR